MTKIGIVGVGSIGKRHLSNAMHLGHSVKGYDPLTWPHDFKYERELYDWCDAAVICTPSPYHESGFRACMERGKHVLIEKPISVGVGGLSTLLDEAENRKLVVMMGNNLRFHPAIKLMKKTFSVVQWANFICATKTDKVGYLSDGVILCTGAHEVDLALHLWGHAEVATACGDEESIDFVLRHETGMRSSFHLDFTTEVEVRQIRFADPVESVMVDLPERTMRQDFGNGVYRQNRFAGSYDDDYVEELEAFVAAIHGEPLEGASGEDGLETLGILLDIQKRIKNTS